MSQSPATSGSQSKEPARPKKSGLAIASLICGIAGIVTCGLSAVAGLILGIIALSRIGKSAGQLTGRGLAIAGIIISAATPVLLAMLVAVLLPAVRRAREHAPAAVPMNNMGQLCRAAIVYAANNHGNFPPPESWPEALRNYVLDDRILADPSDADAGRMFAMNALLRDKRIDEICHPARTVLFFECASGAPLAGDAGDMPAEPRFRDGYIVGFANSHVAQVAPQETDDLIWDPDQEP